MRKFGLLAVTAVITGVLAACGGSGGNGAAATPVGGAVTSAPQAAGGVAGDAAKGQALFNSGDKGAPPCISCHNVDASKGVLVGPNQAGIATRAESRFKEANYKGQAKDAAGYLKESIVNPNVYIVEGFQPNIMYQDYGKTYSDAQINDLVAYLLTLK